MFIPLSDILAKIKPHHLVFHNASYDLHTINLYTDKTWLPKKVDDTIYLSRLQFFEQKSFSFYKCLSYAGIDVSDIQDMDKPAMQKADWSGPLKSDMIKYAEADVTYLSKLYDVVYRKGSEDVYKLDINNLKYAIHYDRKGLPINTDAIQEMLLEYMGKLEQSLRIIPVNPNSPKQCCEWLGTNSSNATILGLKALKGDKRATQLLEARKYSKIVMFLKKYDRPIMKGFHNPCGAITGRFSCSGGDRYDHENTQQPPKVMFPCIASPDGYKIVYMDFSGLELRMAVAYTGEETMAAMMKQGLDLHTHTGCYLFDCTPSTLPKLKRIITKFYNFGIAYGAGIKTLRDLLRSEGRIDLTYKEVARDRTKWLEMYPYFEAWHTVHKRHLTVYNYLDITTALGRTIRTYTLTDSLNFPIQGSAAEVTKMAVHYLYTRYDTDPEIINVVHDSVALLKPDSEAELWRDRLNACMVDAWYYVIKELAIPDIPMPPEAEIITKWHY